MKQDTLLKIILSIIGAASECLYPLLMLPNLLQTMCCALEADRRIKHHELQVQNIITTPSFKTYYLYLFSGFFKHKYKVSQNNWSR